MSNRAVRACEGCRVRKVKCSNGLPCTQCSHLHLRCSYKGTIAPRGPAVRNRLVEQLREFQNNLAIADASSKAALSFENGGSLVPGKDNRSKDEGTPFYSLLVPQNSQWTKKFFIELLDRYEEQVYPVNPIITRQEIRAAIDCMHKDLDEGALVYAFAAVTINLTTPTPWTAHGEIGVQMTELMQQSLKAYRMAEMLRDWERSRFCEVNLTFKRIMTCVFLEISMMAFNRFDRSLSVLREAQTMVQILHVQQASHGATPLEGSELARFQRLYWEVFIHERFLTTLSGYPCVMHPLPSGLPVSDHSIPAHVDIGFNRLIRLFQLMDGPFLAYWRAQQNPSEPVQGISAEWIEMKQAQLDQDEREAAEAEGMLLGAGVGPFTELQHVDLFVTRLWLRTLLWQFGLTHGFLRSTPPKNSHEGLSIHFPTHRLSVQLRDLVSRLDSVASIVTHGSGILAKLFEITSTVADVLALPLGYGQSQDDVRTRIEDFTYLVKFLFSFERVEKDQRDYLREKLEVLRHQYTAADFGDIGKASPPEPVKPM
ncbi:hypothetical protein PT974_01463 [Cladobotryum mycophilum]|uniref:Zn(2)-C6 fungal-type domain-containing protein n=1 Tax=Cladobotryum mycophilum TaxID=491253 RepID=A0ABR0T4V2_9HYPO